MRCCADLFVQIVLAVSEIALSIHDQIRDVHSDEHLREIVHLSFSLIHPVVAIHSTLTRLLRQWFELEVADDIALRIHTRDSKECQPLSDNVHIDVK